jgi:hypothetical protein
MKLAEHVDTIRELIEATFDKHFARLGIGKNSQLDIERLPEEVRPKRLRFEEMLESHKGETGDYEHARIKLIDELTFTLFNRLAAVKVMEAAVLFPPILTKQAEHGDRSFGHKAWLEINPHMRSEELEGIREYIKYAFDELGETLPLYSRTYPYALLPDAISLNEIIDAFNDVEKDSQVDSDIWQSDDVLGWMYESYNNKKKLAHKESKDKTEFDKVSLQSQVYTPRWVVQFLVENSLGKLYMEMYPDSKIKNSCKIANAPTTQERDAKPLHEIKIIDPACGSGNFLLYAFDFFYELYLDRIENYDSTKKDEVKYDEKNIPKLIIENNLHGIDLDDRGVQLAQLGLFIKAKKKRSTIGELNFKVVSSDFYLPDYEEVKEIFEPEEEKKDFSDDENRPSLATSASEYDNKSLISEIWDDLKYAYKFGSLIQINERLMSRLKVLVEENDSIQPELFLGSQIQEHRKFAAQFIENLKIAVEKYAKAQGNTFLTSKTRDAITFLELLTTKYDVATANPPYTDSSDFGPDLKKFIEANYKKPYKFNTNLYATFIKRCYELTGEDGKVAMVHPPTFMYIKTFEDVRKFMIDKTSIDLFVEWGYLGMFHPSARVDAAMYVLDKKQNTKDATFIKLNHIYEGKRYQAFVEAYNNLVAGINHANNYTIPQSKLKIIKSWPFIYWISDDFREKFGIDYLSKNYVVSRGLNPGRNEKYLRFTNEVRGDYLKISKGGPFIKWFGASWMCIDLERNKNKIGKEQYSSLSGSDYYTREGLFTPRVGSKGPSFKFKEADTLFSDADLGVFPKDKSESVFYALGILNSKVVRYINDAFNPTVNITVGDISRIPIVNNQDSTTALIDNISRRCYEIKKSLTRYTIYESEYTTSPVNFNKIQDLRKRLNCFYDYENLLNAHVLINEAIVNERVFEVYDLTDHDKAMVLAKEGESIGGLPVSSEARDAYMSETEVTKEFQLDDIHDFIEALPAKEFSADEREAIESGFPTIYQSNNDLEEFCIRHQVNPINVWYWFKQSNVIPQQRMHTLAMEFLADMIREILMEDEDGIIPLVSNAGEKVLLDRVEEKFHEKGFSYAQYSSFDSVLGRPLHEYLNKYFFAELSDHLNLFMYLPKTPFIWHLSSGPEQGFDCYLIIYKWSRDKLLRLRSVYIEHRERALVNRQSDLSGNESADAQNEKDLIFRQLNEIEEFKKKIDELLEEGYDPILDDGVGKNIAPLQKKKMLTYDVLNAGQLKKYLNADW